MPTPPCEARSKAPSYHSTPRSHNVSHTLRSLTTAARVGAHLSLRCEVLSQTHPEKPAFSTLRLKPQPGVQTQHAWYPPGIQNRLIAYYYSPKNGCGLSSLSVESESEARGSVEMRSARLLSPSPGSGWFLFLAHFWRSHASVRFRARGFTGSALRTSSWPPGPAARLRAGSCRRAGHEGTRTRDGRTLLMRTRGHEGDARQL